MIDSAPNSLRAPTFDAVPEIVGAPPKLGVLASGSGTNFDAIARAVADGDLGADLVCMVCNNPGAGAFDVAARHGVDAELVDHREFGSRRAFDHRVLEVLAEHDVEWVIMAGWMRLVTPEFIDAYRGQILNIHPSLLPSFRGLDAVGQALAAGVKITGVTVHHVVSEVDSGPIVAQAAVPVLDGDTPDSLHARIQVHEHFIYPRAIALAVADARRARG
jgi:phosphoribosylglycinamide formyltransferase 1